MVFAAIDIGSNAIRLLFCRVYVVKNKPHFVNEELFRLPIRLGDDVFLHGFISEPKIKKLTSAMRSFSELINVYQVNSYRAVATSAMRDAKNSAEIVTAIKTETGINIEIIDGKLEASLVFSNHIEQLLNPNHSYLYIDVGGGSTELTLYQKNNMVASKSFNIGTIRLLYDKVTKTDWDEMQAWLIEKTTGVKPIDAIGSGGNINKLFKMAKKSNKYFSYNDLFALHNLLNSYSLEEKMNTLGLKPDRADVISHASNIFTTVMKTANIGLIHVPKIGLSDGIVHELYNQEIKFK